MKFRERYHSMWFSIDKKLRRRATKPDMTLSPAVGARTVCLTSNWLRDIIHLRWWYVLNTKTWIKSQNFNVSPRNLTDFLFMLFSTLYNAKKGTFCWPHFWIYIYLYRMVLWRLKFMINEMIFDFDIVNFPFLDGDVPLSASYGVYISQLIRFARVSSHVDDFNTRNKVLTAKFLRQG